MKTKSIPPLLAGALLALAFAACDTTQTTGTGPTARPPTRPIASGEGCRTRTHAGAQSLDMCSAQHFTDVNADDVADFRAGAPVASMYKPGGVASIKLRTKWKKEQLRVAFLNDPMGLKDQVLSIANEWNTRGGAAITFVQVSDPAASDIRITFQGSGYWSYLGNQANNFPGRPTMSLSFRGKPRTQELRRVTLHEFGHALGLLHEHQQPLATINWDKDACYRHYGGPPNCWSPSQVDSQVLTKNPPSADLPSTAFDAHSIMQYAIDDSLTTDGRGNGWNYDLSALDKRFIADIYKKSAPIARSAPSRSRTTVKVANASSPAAPAR